VDPLGCGLEESESNYHHGSSPRIEKSAHSRSSNRRCQHDGSGFLRDFCRSRKAAACRDSRAEEWDDIIRGKKQSGRSGIRSARRNTTRQQVEVDIQSGRSTGRRSPSRSPQAGGWRTHDHIDRDELAWTDCNRESECYSSGNDSFKTSGAGNPAISSSYAKMSS